MATTSKIDIGNLKTHEELLTAEMAADPEFALEW
jgi:hypothetical protein